VEQGIALALVHHTATAAKVDQSNDHNEVFYETFKPRFRHISQKTYIKRTK
jgi:hypothetical protein